VQRFIRPLTLAPIALWMGKLLLVQGAYWDRMYILPVIRQWENPMWFIPEPYWVALLKILNTTEIRQF